MTQTELDRIYKANRWLIAKKTGSAGIKAFTVGRESLEALIGQIADAYGLSDEDRARLRPTAGIDLHEGAGKLADMARKSAGVMKGVEIVADARRAGTLMKTGRHLVTKGLPGAARVAKGAKAAGVAGRAVPWVTVAVSAYAIGSAGFFAAKAERYNRDCRDLLQARLDAAKGTASAS